MTRTAHRTRHRRRHRRAGDGDGAAEGRHRRDGLRGASDGAPRASASFLTLAPTASTRCACSAPTSRCSPPAFPTPGDHVAQRDGQAAGGEPHGRELPDGTTSHTLRRADLYRALHDEAPRGASASSTASGWSTRTTPATASARCSPTARGRRRRADRLPTASTPPCGGSSTRPRPRRPTPGCSTTGGYAARRAAVDADARPLRDDLRPAGVLRLRRRARRRGLVVRQPAAPRRARRAASCRRSAARVAAPAARAATPATPGPADALDPGHPGADADEADPLDPAPADVAPRADGRRRRRRARALADVRAGRVAVDRGRRRARQVPARPARPGGGVRPLRGRCAARGSSGSSRRRPASTTARRPARSARVVRDAMLPAILKLTADGKAQRRIHEHHIEWGAPAVAA